MSGPRTSTTVALALAVFLCRCSSDEPESDSSAGGVRDSSADEARNVLLITMDTTRADRIGTYGYGRAATPTLDRLASEGVLFERAMTVSPVTLPSHTSILTGQYPIEHGVHDNGVFRAPDSLDTLAEKLSQHGYETAGFVSSYILSAPYGLHQGFDTFDDEMTTSGGREMGHLERRAAQTVNAALQWVEEAPPEPWFLWLHFYDPHMPYLPPDSFTTDLTDPYDAEISYLDSQIDRFLRKYDVGGRLDRTLTMITSDHGEGLGEHGEVTHGLFIYDATMWVPLIVRDGAWAGGRRIGGQVSVVDLYPTVLEALDLTVPDGLDGQSLLRVLRGEESEVWHDAYLETQLPFHYLGMAAVDGFSDRQRKFIQAPDPELYDRTADPREDTNVIGRGDPSLEELQAKLEAIRAGRDPLGLGPNRSLDAAERARLAQLGYILETDSESGPEVPNEERRDPKDYLRVEELRDESRRALRAKEFDRALLRIQEALEICPGDASSHGQLGEVYLFSDRVEEAIPHLETCLRIRPDLTGNTLNLARAHESMGNDEEALGCYELLVTYAPSQVDAHFDAARLHLQLGSTERAAELLDRVRRMNKLRPDEQVRLERLQKSLDG